MLHNRSHWHFASERDPFGEARVLWFAQTPKGGNKMPEDLPEKSAFAPKSGPFDPKVETAHTPAVEGTIDATRAKTDRTLGGKESSDPQSESGTGTPSSSESVKQVNYREILKRCKSLTNKINNYRDQIAAILKIGVQKENDQKTQEACKQLQEVDEQLNTQLGPLHKAQEKAQVISDWKQGKTLPQEYIDWMKKHREEKLPGGEEDKNEGPQRQQQYVQAAQFIQDTKGKSGNGSDAFADLTTPELWMGGPVYNNQSSKIAAIQKIDDLIGTEDELKDIDGILTPLEESLKEHKEAFDALEKTREKIDTPVAPGDAQGKIGWNIEWYSLMDIYIGTKDWWETYASVWEEKAKLRQGKIQYGVSKMMEWLPYGEDAAHESIKKLDGHHRENKGKYKEQLEDEKPKFLTLFGRDGKFNKNNVGYNPDYLMAILEYGADHGWLYELKDTSAVNGVKVETLLPKHWDKKRRDIYLDSLIGQNEDGFEKEADSTDKNIRKKYDAKKDFLEKELDAYLADINIGAALGTMRAMYERGIDGDEGGYIAVHFFRALRKYPELRRYMTSTRLQNIARASAGKGYFTMTNLWTDRAPLSKISTRPESAMRMQESGQLAKAIDTAERLIRTTSGQTFDTDEEIAVLDDMVARLLTGRVITFENKKSVSIWSKEFDFYRDEQENFVHTFAESGGAKDTANDYFAQDSEVLMISEKFLVGLFTTTSTGTWENKEKAQNFVGKIMTRYKQLQESYPQISLTSDEHPANIFKAQLKDKIQSAILSNLARADSIHTYMIRDFNKDVLHEEPNGTKEKIPAIAWLEANGFLDLAELGKPADKLREAINDDVIRIRTWTTP